MFSFLQRKQTTDVHFSYEEKRYPFGVKVLVALLTGLLLIISWRFLADINESIPYVPYPDTSTIPEVKAHNDFQNNVLQPLYQRQYTLQSEEQQARNAYDSSLLEDIAGEDDTLYGGEDAVRNTVERLEKEVADVQADIAVKEAELKVLWERSEEAQKPVIEAYEWQVKIRQLHIFLREALFWIPFFLLSLWWYSRNRRQDSKWEVVSLACLIASGIIALQSVCTVLWSWIPHWFLEWLWILIGQAIALRMIFYYLMLALVVGILGGAIVWIQRRITDPARTGKRRINHGMCPTCNYPLNQSDTYCGCCGKQLKEPCTSCKKPGYVWQACCIHCGTKKGA